MGGLGIRKALYTQPPPKTPLSPSPMPLKPPKHLNHLIICLIMGNRLKLNLGTVPSHTQKSFCPPTLLPLSTHITAPDHLLVTTHWPCIQPGLSKKLQACKGKGVFSENLNFLKHLPTLEACSMDLLKPISMEFCEVTIVFYYALKLRQMWSFISFRFNTKSLQSQWWNKVSF